MYFYVNGDIYEGDWVNNNKDGQGIYTYADTGKLMTCIYSNQVVAVVVEMAK